MNTDSKQTTCLDEKDTDGKKLQLPSLTGEIQTIHKEKNNIQHRYWTANQKAKTKADCEQNKKIGHWDAKQHIWWQDPITETNRTKFKLMKHSNYVTDAINWKERKTTNGALFRTKQSNTETPEDHGEKLSEVGKDCDFPNFTINLLVSNIIASITDKKNKRKVDYQKRFRITENSRTDRTKYRSKKKNMTLWLGQK